jgi:riboflavin-specific deaminase-like protein
VWTLLLALAESRQADSMPLAPAGFKLASHGRLATTDRDDRAALLTWDEEGLHAGPNQPPPVSDLVALYAPLFPAEPGSSVIVGHLGQSIDAQIATQSGDSSFVNGPANIVHLHHMRALCDAVVVGARTAIADNPHLTTRLVDGNHPVRVVIDPDRRTPLELGLFNDGEAPSLLACANDRLAAGDDPDSVIGVPRAAAGLALPELVSALQARGLRTLFVEGGGITVSRWMIARLLDRLQICVAPLFIGEGRPGLQLPAVAAMSACRRPPTRVFRLGDDLLWDFDLRGDDLPPPDQRDAQAFWPCRVV